MVFKVISQISLLCFGIETFLDKNHLFSPGWEIRNTFWEQAANKFALL